MYKSKQTYFRAMYWHFEPQKTHKHPNYRLEETSACAADDTTIMTQQAANYNDNASYWMRQELHSLNYQNRSFQ